MGQSDAVKPRVLVVQMGARHNYAVPTIFERAGMLEAFYTDMCAGKGLGRIASLVSYLVPNDQIKALANRRPPPEVLRRTKTFDAETLRYRISRLIRKGGSAKETMAMYSHVGRLGRRMLEYGLQGSTHLYTSLGEGQDLLEKARRGKIRTAVDVIIALSWHDIVAQEYKDYPGWGDPPLDVANAGGRMACRNIVTVELGDRLICPSSFVRDDLVCNYGIDPEKIVVVPYSIHEDWLTLPSKPVAGRVLFVGTADLRKGIHYLAMAANYLSKKGKSYDVRVAGGVEDRVRTQRVCRNLEFLGRVPRSMIANEYKRADVFVLPSLVEGSAGVIYEALAAGIPVVTTRSSGSIVRDGVDGFIVPERDPVALAKAINEIISDRSLRKKMSEAARENARHYTWENYAKRLIPAVVG